MDLRSALMSKPAVNVILMIVFKVLGLEPPVLATRVIFGACMAAHLGCLALLLLRIRSGPEGRKFKCREVDAETQR